MGKLAEHNLTLLLCQSYQAYNYLTELKNARDLEAGNELEAREINVLLTTQQRQQLKADWQAQQKLSAGGGFHFNDLSQG